MISSLFIFFSFNYAFVRGCFPCFDCFTPYLPAKL
nr:MAG TPA: hypothetical protein [Caudoviricetes sp.]